ncbi:MAG TPA: ATP synthase F1 subunit gamma [Candidatus Binatia bacterium]|nr:ATP synthase F1 subunit gamma [Candidatus Binatia bacterium]
MPTLITLKRRISSIKNTKQITKAMQMVSASKLRRAQEQALASRDYREAAYGLLARLSQTQEVEQQPLFRHRPIHTRLYIVITSNSGLAGAYNSNVLKLLAQALKEDEVQKVKSQVITIGNKGVQFVRRLNEVELLAHYPAPSARPSEDYVRPILNFITEHYQNEKVDEVRLLYTDFRSTVTQQVVDLPLLPAEIDVATEPTTKAKASSFTNFEPDAETVVASVAARLIEIQIWQGLLESSASEHSMRMIAMKNATDNASGLIEDYTLEYNTARQAAITQELAEITGGAEALNG